VIRFKKKKEEEEEEEEEEEKLVLSDKHTATLPLGTKHAMHVQLVLKRSLSAKN